MVGLAVASIDGCRLVPTDLQPVGSRCSSRSVTDESGLPRYWSAIWSVASSGQLAASTHAKKLRYIEDLYAHADRLLGKHALDDALGSLNETALAEILESWFVSIRNRSTVTRSDEKRWQTGLAFVTSTVTWLSTSGTSNDRLQRIEQRIHRLSTLYSQLHVHKTAQAEIIRSLPASTVERLYQTLDPASVENPFKRTRKRWCVFVAFVLMLHQGLRRGEMLLLPADVIKSEYDHKRQRRGIGYPYAKASMRNLIQILDIRGPRSRPSIHAARFR
jgi:hypothetical protein